MAKTIYTHEDLAQHMKDRDQSDCIIVGENVTFPGTVFKLSNDQLAVHRIFRGEDLTYRHKPIYMNQVVVNGNMVRDLFFRMYSLVVIE